MTVASNGAFYKTSFFFASESIRWWLPLVTLMSPGGFIAVGNKIWGWLEESTAENDDGEEARGGIKRGKCGEHRGKE